MTSMSYCRHENTAIDMQQVVDMWYEDSEGRELNEYEKRGRKRIIALAQEIIELAEETEEL